MKIKVFLFNALIFIFSCGKKTENPKDFNFELKGPAYYVSSYDQTLKPNCILTDSIYELKFSRDELKNIYNGMLKNKVNSIPEQFTEDPGNVKTHYSIFTLKYTYFGLTRTIFYSDCCEVKEKEKSNLFRIVNKIDSILLKKSEFVAIPKCI